MGTMTDHTPINIPWQDSGHRIYPGYSAKQNGKCSPDFCGAYTKITGEPCPGRMSIWRWRDGGRVVGPYRVVFPIQYDESARPYTTRANIRLWWETIKRIESQGHSRRTTEERKAIR